MDRRESDFEIPWPSFVDILSAVIIMFIFFILVIVIIMSIMTVQKQENLVEEKEAQIEEELKELMSSEDFKSEASPIVQKMAETIKKLQEQIQEQQEKDSQESASAADAEEPTKEEEEIQTRTQMKQAQKQIIEQGADFEDSIIYYNRGEVTLSDDSKEILSQKLRTIKNIQNKKIVLNIADNPEALTETQGREQSLARALNLRNLLLENNIQPQNVRVIYTEAEKKSGGFEWIELKVE